MERNKASRANQKKQGAAASRAGKSSASGDLNMGINVAAAPVVPSDHWSNIFGVTSNMRNSLSTSHRGASEYGAEALHHHSAGGGAANASGRFSVFFNKPNAVPDTIVETQGDSDDEERDSLVPSSMINKTLDAMNAVADVGVDGDFIYNLMDNYAAILTSALIHVGLVDALCHLGSYADSSLAVKCRTLLVDLLTVVCGIFPESTCAELLEIPHLVAYAATVSNSTSVVSRSLKASDILSKLAGSFSNSISGRISGNVANNTASLYSNPFISGSFSNVPSNTNSKTTVSYATGSKGNSAHAGEHAAASLNTKESVGSIAILMKSSCKPRVDGLLMSCRDSSAINDLMYDLRHAITAAIDKVEFNRQMEGSKVIGKEGKEPFKWNWALIDDMLEYSFKNPERLPEALRTKWVKRLSGFYRCTVDEKAYFANLDWESVNMIYLECACNMYHVLVGGDVGMTFLSGGDRRGMLFNEMSYELETLVGSTSKGWNGTHEAKNVFRMHNCSQTLAREYFTLLGRMSTTAPGRKLLDSTQVFQHLSMLGHQRSLDYVSRLALTALTFTDGGYFSRNLLQIFTTSGGCSSELRFYTHTLLRAMLRKSRDTEFVTWGIEMMVTQMLYFPTASLAKVLEEAAQDIQYLKALVSKKANFIGKPNTDAILLRYCALSDGIAFLQENEWLTKAMSHWEKTGNLEYTTKTELSMAKALALCCKKMKNPEVTTPIPIAADVYHNATPNSTLESGVCVDLEGLLRIPWNIEVKLSTTPQQQPSVTANLSAWEYLKVDSFLDASSLVSTACGDVSSDHLRLVKVRGLVLDSTGLPCGHPIAASRIIASALLCGVSPVLRTGKVVNLSQHAPSKYAQAKEKRRVTLSQMKSDYDKLNKSSSASIRSSLSLGGDTHFVEPDLPVTFQFEPFQDWSFCKPQHRCGRVLELPNDRFSVEVPGEPVVFVFSRSAPKMLKRVATDSSMVSNTRRSLSKDDIETNNVRRNSGVRVQQPPGIVYLVEIHYYLRLKTNQDTFVPIPRHLYGELSRNSVGINILREHVVVKTLLRTLNDEDTVSAKRRSALWALGHIGATSAGYNMISREMPRFVKWIISIATTSLDYSLRATAFIVLGLVGRSHGGGIHLAAEKWGISPRIGVAVAIPKDLSSLFCMHINPNSTANTPLDSPCNPAPAPPLLMRYPSFKKHPDLTSFEYVHLLKPFMPRESVKVVKSTKTPVEPVECNAGESTLEKKSKKTKKNSLSGMFNKKLNIVEKEPVGTTTEETVTNTTANNVDEERDDCPFTRSEIDVLNAIAKVSISIMRQLFDELPYSVLKMNVYVAIWASNV